MTYGHYMYQFEVLFSPGVKACGRNSRLETCRTQFVQVYDMVYGSLKRSAPRSSIQGSNILDRQSQQNRMECVVSKGAQEL